MSSLISSSGLQPFSSQNSKFAFPQLDDVFSGRADFVNASETVMLQQAHMSSQRSHANIECAAHVIDWKIISLLAAHPLGEFQRKISLGERHLF